MPNNSGFGQGFRGLSLKRNFKTFYNLILQLYLDEEVM